MREGCARPQPVPSIVGGAAGRLGEPAWFACPDQVAHSLASSPFWGGRSQRWGPGSSTDRAAEPPTSTRGSGGRSHRQSWLHVGDEPRPRGCGAGPGPSFLGGASGRALSPGLDKGLQAPSSASCESRERQMINAFVPLSFVSISWGDVIGPFGRRH